MAQHHTRLAPSPTGALHLGNARTFLLNWALARQQGWGIVLRIEDLDSPRVKQGSAGELIETLNWLGLDWDEGPFFQTDDLAPYRDALARMARQGAIYSCRCTRSEILAASLSAPHQGEHELCYPGTCRPAEPLPAKMPTLAGQASGWRVRVSPGIHTFCDEFVGEVSIDTASTVGDFLVATKEGTPSYQLAVVVDDALQKVDRVVRGDDLLPSVARQHFLYELLDLGPPPKYWHVPLVVGNDGRRLAKRHGDTRITSYRAAGTPKERLIGLIAHWSGHEELAEMTSHEFADRLDMTKVPAEPVVVSTECENWLRGD